MALLTKLFRNLTAPSTKLSTLDQQKASSFSLTLIILILLGAVAQSLNIISALNENNPSLASSYINGYIRTVLFLAPSYLLSRTRYYKAGAFIFGLLVNLGIYYQITGTVDLRDIPEYSTYLYILILPVILCSLLITTRLAISMTLLSFLTCYILFINEPAFSIQRDNIFSSIIFISLVSSFTIMANRYRNWVEQKNKADLIKSETKYRQLLGTAFEGVVSIEDGNILEANQLFASLFGYEENEIVGTALADFVPNSDSIYSQNSLSSEGMSEDVLELHGVHKRGTPLILEALVHEQQVEGRPVLALAVRDITHRRETEATILQAQRLDSIGVLAGGIAHDFNNLLTGIMGHSSLIRMKLDKEHKAQRHVDGIISTTKHAGELTQQLMTYAGKRTEINATAPLDLNKLVHDNQGWFETTIGRQVGLTFDLQQGLPFIEADRSQIQQVLMNLVINARDACEAGGDILITTCLETLVEEKPVYMLNQASPVPGEYVCLQVRDTGSGVAPEVIERIFEPFYSTKGQGRGLGLAATLGVIQGHNGYVSLETAVSQGTTFNVYFPASQKTANQAVLDAPSPSTSSSTAQTILLIEDEPSIRNLVSEGLRKVGYAVVTAEDGIDGIGAFKKQQAIIDLIVLDVQMPIMDGVDVLHYIKKLSPHVPVIISSGYSTVDLTTISEQYSAVSFLPKPYTVTQLANFVDAV